MEFLKELLNIEVLEEKKKPLTQAAKSVYHRDYVKTKKKLYRKYDPAHHAGSHHTGEE